MTSKKLFLSKDLEIKKSTILDAGHGVFALKDIPSNTVIEQCPVKIFHNDVVYPDLESTWVTEYAFRWNGISCCICFGWGGIYNHSRDANLTYQLSEDPVPSMIFTTLRKIKQGEELFVKYFHNDASDEIMAQYYVERNQKTANVGPHEHRKNGGDTRIQRRKKLKMGTFKTLATFTEKY
ncbi:SET domain-containing protein-lysine N-methyltransferase [bacterium]|nr:SET domain-containing protein-lysine N-methyltransferase [bacterium]